MKKIFIALIFLLNFSSVEAEDLQFIDADGDTGYYFDCDSIKKINAETFTVDFIVIHAERNEMSVANLEINHAQKNYIVLESKILSYDSRTELREENIQRIVKPYSTRSLMQQIVRKILHNKPEN